MAEIEDMMCCGINEISGVSRDYPADIIEEVRDKMFPATENAYNTARKQGMSIFSDIERNKTNREENGWKFAAYLTKKKLGKVTKIATFKNPNTNNKVTVWQVVWDLNKLKAFEDACECCGK